ncbi:MAG TPA: hypothetical protein VHG71_00610 [Verrucomicrobiae bacterium]|nr:hypothetical protein [Verrucomicrobiae bacterium]
MKSEMTNNVLKFILLVLVILAVWFTLWTVKQTRDYRSLSTQVAAKNNYILRAQALANDVAVYNQKTPSPELTRILQSIQPKAPAH